MKSLKPYKAAKKTKSYRKSSAKSASPPVGIKIGEISKKSGIPVVTLRFFENERLIQPISNSRSNHRRYHATVLTDLDFIRVCRNSGFSIAETRSLMRHWRGFKLPSKTGMNALKRSIDTIRAQKAGLDVIERILLSRLRDPERDVEELLSEEPEIIHRLRRALKIR